jgi:hypothetical protein
MAQNTLQVSWALAKDPAFIRKIMYAAERAAIAVQAEDPETANHTERSALANAILHNLKGESAKFAQAVAADPGAVGISNETTDNDLLFTVSSVFNALALGG